MPDDFQIRLSKGVRNLLLECASCSPGDTVLIVHETENDGYYDPELAGAVSDAAVDLGLKVRTWAVPLNRSVTDPDAALVAEMRTTDCTVFFARLGDQIRFRTKDASKKQIVSYALDREMLASPFGTVAYNSFDTLKRLINRACTQAEQIHVTCPEGTDFQGWVSNDMGQAGDTTRKRFPVSVFTPINADTFSGKIAQRGFLTGTGSNYYDPYTCKLKDTLLVSFEGARITGFDGSARDVAAARAHYEFVGKTFGIDSYCLHSWHVGIHPGCHYPLPAQQNFERWSGGAFGNPRLLHFHSCGDYPPGEISLNVLDPTVSVDGVMLWDRGRLHPERLSGGPALLAQYPDMQAVFAAPSLRVGQSDEDRLAYA